MFQSVKNDRLDNLKITLWKTFCKKIPVVRGILNQSLTSMSLASWEFSQIFPYVRCSQRNILMSTNRRGAPNFQWFDPKKRIFSKLMKIQKTNCQRVYGFKNFLPTMIWFWRIIFLLTRHAVVIKESYILLLRKPKTSWNVLI